LISKLSNFPFLVGVKRVHPTAKSRPLPETIWRFLIYAGAARGADLPRTDPDPIGTTMTTDDGSPKGVAGGGLECLNKKTFRNN
jgi:hypothetical protein